MVLSGPRKTSDGVRLRMSQPHYSDSVKFVISSARGIFEQVRAGCRPLRILVDPDMSMGGRVEKTVQFLGYTMAYH